MTLVRSPYAHVTDPMWNLWLRGGKKVIPGVRLGGIYANNTGYHNTLENLLARYPWSYAAKLAMDKKGPDDEAAAIDFTMSRSEMIKRTKYLRRSALHPQDNRLRAMREFIGTLDGDTVYCRIGGNEGLGQGRGRDDWTRDKTHLWHIHESILRAFVDDWEALEPIASVMSGETWEEWQTRKDDEMWFEKKHPISAYWKKLFPNDKQIQDGYVGGNTTQISGYFHSRHNRELTLTRMIPMLETLLATKAGCSVDEMRGMLREELAKGNEVLLEAFVERMNAEHGQEVGEAAGRVLAEIIEAGVAALEQEEDEQT